MWLSLLLSTQNNENNYKVVERETERQSKIYIFKKEFGKRSFIYDIRNIHNQFWSKYNQLLGVLNWHAEIPNFPQKRYEIDIVTCNLFPCKYT